MDTDQRTPVWTFGDRIMKARRTAGFTQTSLAAALRVNRQKVLRWEADRYTPGYLETLEIARLCDVPVEWLDPDIRSRCSDSTPGREVA